MIQQAIFGADKETIISAGDFLDVSDEKPSIPMSKLDHDTKRGLGKSRSLRAVMVRLLRLKESAPESTSTIKNFRFFRNDLPARPLA